jgi:predicted dehydrogenase
VSGTLRVGIAGYGVVGKRRRQFIDEHPRMKTVAVCDQKFRSSGRFKDGVRFYRRPTDLLRQKLDVLFVCLPNYLAADLTVKALGKGLHVFCEKPPGRTIADIKNVIAAEKSARGKRLKYGFNHRYHDSIRDALRIVKRKELGQLVNMRGLYGKSKIVPFSGGWRAERRYAGGGILLDQGIHMIDIMHLFAGKFVEAKSFVSNAYWNQDVEDNAFALLKDSKGRIAMLHSTATQWAHRFSLEVTFTQGYLVLRGILSGSKSYGQEQLIIGRRAEADTGAAAEESRIYLKDNSWRDEVNEFADCILKRKPVKWGTSREALAAMETVYRIYNADPSWCSKYEIEYVD